MTDFTHFPDNMLSTKDLATKREQQDLERRAQAAQDRVDGKPCNEQMALALIKSGLQPK